MKCEEIYQGMNEARKNNNKIARSILSLANGNIKNKAIELKVEKLSDADTYSIIKKMIKQLEEEIELFKKVNKTEKVEELELQHKVLSNYLPQQLSEDKIREIISTLEDKTIPSIMKYFKTNYNGQVDMGLVNRIAKQ